MKTSCFQHPGITKDPRAVSIARFTPRWWGAGRRYIALAPSAGLLRDWKQGNIATWHGYAQRYRNEVLLPLDPVQVYADLENSIIVCWCKDQYICHRRLVADWLKEHIGVDIPEI